MKRFFKGVLALLIGILLQIVIAGCATPMINDEVIKEAQKCADAGMHVQIVQNWRMQTVMVNCIVKNTE
jgi:hypothetical protein